MRRALATAAAATLNAAAGNECEPKFDKRLRAWARAGFSGSIAVSSRAEFDCLADYGVADRTGGWRNTIDTVFSIGSVSKAFAVAAVVDLVDAGRRRRRHEGRPVRATRPSWRRAADLRYRLTIRPRTGRR